LSSIANILIAAAPGCLWRGLRWDRDQGLSAVRKLCSDGGHIVLGKMNAIKLGHLDGRLDVGCSSKELTEERIFGKYFLKSG
jgi:hypothetical protein